MNERESVCKVVAVISKDELSYERLRRVYSVEYAHPCIAINGTYLTGILIEMSEEELAIRDNTRLGYRIGKEGDGVVTDQPRARGTVQKDMTPTVLTQQGGGCGVIVKTPLRYNLGISPNRIANESIDPNGPMKTISIGHGGIALPKVAECEEMTEDRLKALIENPMPEEEVQRLIAAQKLTVRKLTPRECWRLMGMADEDYEKAAKVCSESQLYKQAGNSIVVDVLEAIFENMLTETKTVKQCTLGEW